MAKSRAEIQKAYRERQKAKGPAFLESERKRSEAKRVPSADLTPAQRKKRQMKSRQYCKTYRLKVKQKKEALKTSTDSVTQSDVITSTSGPSSSAANDASSNNNTRSSGTDKLLVQLDFKRRSGPSKRRSKALIRASKNINQLKAQLSSEKKNMEKWKKRFLRLQKQSVRHEAKSCLSGSTSAMTTPKSKTKQEIKRAGLSPRCVPRSIVRKLQLSNCFLAEIESARKENPMYKHKQTINTVISGKIVKKYRFARYLGKTLGIGRSRIGANSSKQIRRTSQTRQSRLKAELSAKVSSFFERDDVSRCMPGKQDAVRIEGERKQTRILNDYLRNIYEQFRLEEQTVTLSFSAFCKLRPKNIKLTSLLSRNTCLCTKHQNMALKLKCLKSLGVDISPNPEVAKTAVSITDMDTKLAALTTKSIEYEEWQRVERDGKLKMRVVKVSKSKDDFVKIMSTEYKFFLEHVDRVRQQYKALHDLKKDLPKGHVLVQMDFAENFTCQSMDEIQSAYWNATSVTIHPVVAYRRVNEQLEHRNFAFISDVNHHNSTAVFAILQKLVPILQSTFPDVETVHYWTDSPSSQYRNRFMFHTVASHFELFGIQARWNYFEAGHGKGPCDGIGGTCKRMAAEAVKQGKVSIQDANDFYKWAKENEQSIEYHYYTQRDYDAASELLAESHAVAVPGTLKIHAVYSRQKYHVYVREISCYCPGCLKGDALCDDWKEHKVARTQTSATDVSMSTGSCTSSDQPAIAEEHDTPTPSMIIPPVSSYVAAHYDEDWFIGKILQVDEESDVHISFMSKHNSKGHIQFKWPARSDDIWVSRKNIICQVSEPRPVGRSARFYILSDSDLQKIGSQV